MDDFEKAILFTFDQSGAVNAQLKSQAQAYCDQLKQSSGFWRACLERIAVSQYVEVQFWCLQSLEEIIRQQYGSFRVDDCALLRQSLTSIVLSSSEQKSSVGGLNGMENSGLVGSGSANGVVSSVGLQNQTRPAFMRNKLAQIVVLLIFCEYPSGWPSIFLDLLQALEQGPHVVDMLCRICNTLDEEIISLDYPRTAEENAAATRIKDAMRQQCVPQMVDSWYRLVVSYERVDPGLSASVLETMQRFIAWMDINLVVNDKWVPLFFQLLSSSEVPERLRGASATCLLAIVLKRMDALQKLSLLQRLQMIQVCSGVTEARDTDFAVKLSSLLTGLASELLECCKKLEVNGAVTAPEAVGASELAHNMLDELLPIVLRFLEHGEEDISVTTFQFLLAYVGNIKKGGNLSSKQQEHLAQVLAVIRSRMRYDPSFEESLAEPDKEGLEEEERMSEYRRDLFTLLKNISRISPEVTKVFMHSCLSTTITGQNTSFEDMEVALALFYQLGEGISEEALKPGSGVMAEMTAVVITSNIPYHSHRAIALLYLEIVVRYVRFIEQHGEYIPAVLPVFLGEKGIHHTNINVASRASYLLMRLVKVLRVKLLPYVETILQSLQDVLAVIATSSSYKVITGRVEGPLDERIYAFEAVGLLIGLEDLPEERMSKYLSALLVPLCQQVDNILLKELRPGDTVGSQATVWSLQQVILAISYLSKGFGEQLTTSRRPEIGGLFKQALDMVLRVLQALPKNKPLRSRVISFLHRMVETLGTSIFPFLPTAIQQLLQESEAKDMVDFIQLMSQLMNKFKSSVLPILSEVLQPLVNRVTALLPASGIPQGLGMNTEEVREQLELQRAFIIMLQAIAANNLIDVFLSPQNNSCLSQVICFLLEACARHPDILQRKACVAVFLKLISDWCGSSNEPEKVSGFRRFAVEQFFPECCVLSVLRSNFDLRDANTFTLFGDIAQAQKTLYEKVGDEFLLHVATVVLPSVHCPPNLAEQYCFHLQRSSVKELKAFLKPLMEQLRPLQNGNTMLQRRPYG